MVCGGGGALANEVTTDDFVDLTLYQAQLPHHWVVSRNTKLLQEDPTSRT